MRQAALKAEITAYGTILARGYQSGNGDNRMMQIFRNQYPDQWEELAAACKEKAGWACEHCGARQHEIRTSQKGNPYFVYLHAAHKNHDKQNPDPVLICLCVSCHARYDYEHRERQARVTLECLKHLKLLIERGQVTARVFKAQERN